MLNKRMTQLEKKSKNVLKIYSKKQSQFAHFHLPRFLNLSQENIQRQPWHNDDT